MDIYLGLWLWELLSPGGRQWRWVTGDEAFSSLHGPRDPVPWEYLELTHSCPHMPTATHSLILKLRIRPYHMNVRETQGNPTSFQSIEPTFKISDCDRIFALQKLFPTASVSSVNIKSELWKANIVHLKSLPSTQILLSSLHCLHQTLRETQGPVLGRRGRRTVNSRPTWAT